VPLSFSPAVFAFAIMVTPCEFHGAPSLGPAALLRCNMAYMRCGKRSVKVKLLHRTKKYCQPRIGLDAALLTFRKYRKLIIYSTLLAM